MILDQDIHNSPGGWKGFIVTMICTAIYGGIKWITSSIDNLDHIVVIALHILSFVSLTVGITVGLVTLQDKLRARKKDKLPHKPE